ncbi:MAG: cation:proton antiporter [Candidatus Nanoarchaeia archaeon]
MDPVLVLFLCGLILFFGLFAEWLFEKTHIPDVFWMVLLGLAMQGVVGRPKGVDDIALLFTTFALIFIVFEGASHIPIRQAATHFMGSVRLSLIHFVFGLFIGTFLGKLVGLNWPIALILGCMTPALSGGILGQIQKYIPTQSGTGTMLAFESALTDVLSILGVVTVLSFSNLTFSTFLNSVLSFLILSPAVGLLLALLWDMLLRKWITQHSYILTVAFLLMVYSITEYAGANGSIAAMAFALTLGNMKSVLSVISKKGNGNGRNISTAEKRFYSEISFLIRSFLFVWMGVIVNFAEPRYLIVGCLACMLLFVVRAYAVHTLRSIPLKDRVYVGAIAPKDVTPIVLATLAGAKVVGAGVLVNVAFGLVITSILLTSLFVSLMIRGRFEGLDVLGRTLAKKFR